MGALAPPLSHIWLTEDIPGARGPATHERDLNGVLGSWFWPVPGLDCCGHLGSRPAYERASSLSISL